MRRIVTEYDGHIAFTKGDGLLAVFGHPHAHENDVHRAASAGLDITRTVAELSDRVRRRFGFDIDVRVGIHRGLVYLDTAQDDVYGFAANLAARLCSLADPGTVAVSEAIERADQRRFRARGAAAETRSRALKVRCGTTVVIGERDIDEESRSARWSAASDELAYVKTVGTGRGSANYRRPAWCFRAKPESARAGSRGRRVDLAERSHAVVLQLIGSPFHTDVGLRPVRRLLERRCGISRLQIRRTAYGFSRQRSGE